MNRLDEKRASVVFERHATVDESHGPGEYGKVGFAIGGNVFWVAAFFFPGTPMVDYAEAVDFANTVVARWNAAAPLPPEGADK